MRKPAFAVSCLLFAGMAAFAADREVFTFVGGNSKAALTDAAYWKDAHGNTGDAGAPLDPMADYLVKDGNSLYTPNTSAVGAGVFNVRSLTLGEVGGTSGNLYAYTTGEAEMTFGERGLICNKGMMVAQWKPLNFAGPVTIGAPSSAAYEFACEYSKTTIAFKDKFKSDAGAGVKFYPRSGARAEDTFCVEIHDATEFLGKLTFGDDTEIYQTTTTLRLGSDMPGSVVVRRTGRLGLLSETNTISLGELTLAADSELSVGSRLWTDAQGRYCGKTGSFKIDGSFSVTGPVRVRFDRDAVVPNGQPCRIPVLTVSDSQRLVADDFTLLASVDDAVQIGEFTVEEDLAAHTKTLVAVFEPVVMMTKSDNQNLNYDGANAITNGEFWSDGLAPHAGSHYLVRSIPGVATNDYKFSTFLHSLSGTTGSDIWSQSYNQVFPGLSLTIGKSCCFLLASRKFTCEKIRLLDGGGICTTLQITTASPALAGNIEVPTGATAYFGTTGKWTVEASVIGGGTIRMPGPLSRTSARVGGVRFSDLSGFHGKMVIMQFESVETGSGHWPSYDESYQTLYIGAGCEYGGTLPELDYLGMTFARYSRLRTVADVTIPASCNRGLYVNGTLGGVVFVDQTDKGVPHVLDIGVPLTLNGSMVKEGVGMLRLRGSAARFGASASETPTTGKNIIEVRTGSLSVASADCLDGAEVSFTDDTKFVLHLNADANFLKYGVRNVKIDTPYLLRGTLARLPLEFDTTELPKSLIRTMGGQITIGLLTVKSSSAAAVRSLLPTKIRPYSGATIDLVEIPRTDIGATTFAINMTLNGMTLLVR